MSEQENFEESDENSDSSVDYPSQKRKSKNGEKPRYKEDEHKKEKFDDGKMKKSNKTKEKKDSKKVDEDHYQKKKSYTIQATKNSDENLKNEQNLPKKKK